MLFSAITIIVDELGWITDSSGITFANLSNWISQNGKWDYSFYTDYHPNIRKGLIHKEDSVYSLISPYYQGYRYQLKVNLHAHTTNRDENYAYSPEDLLRKAREYGFDAFAITDLPNKGGIVKDPEVDNILHIPGIEYGGKPHLIGLGIDSITKSLDKQEQIDHIKNQGGYVYIPHPYWGDYDENLILNYKNIDGLAVFNSLTYSVAVVEGNESNVLSYNEKLIDALLSRNMHIALLVEEDTKYEDPHPYGHQLNTAWMKVWTNISPSEINKSDILNSIKNKRFTSHGRHLRKDPEPPDFVEISTDGLIVYVKLNKVSDITFITGGGTIKKVIHNKKSGSCEVSPSDWYVRIKATHTSNGSSWAWTNPIYIHKM
jgi:hypothetical protein